MEFARHDITAGLLGAGVRLEFGNAMGETPLMVAIRRHNQRAFEMLLASGANARVQDRTGRSALFLAIFEKQEAMALALLDKGADFTSRFDGFTPLRLAQIMQQSKVAEALALRGDRN